MRISPYSTLEHHLVTTPSGFTYEVFSNHATGYESRWNTSSQTDPDLVEGHTGQIITAGDPGDERPFTVPLTQFRGYYPPETAKWKPLSWDEVDDRYPSTHTTGPGARIFTPPAGRYALSTSVGRRDAGITALRTFCRTQFKRPLGHNAPFVVMENLKINPGTPDAWDCDMKTSAGYNAFDPAHASLATEAVAAMLGMDEALEVFFLKYRILARGFPAKTNFWFNQPRAAGWAFQADWLATHLGLGIVDPSAMLPYLGGKAPKQHLKERIDRYCGGSVPYDPLVTGPPDPRTMTVVGPFTSGGTSYGIQCHGEYVWQKNLRTSLLALVASDAVLAPKSPQKKLAKDYVARSVADAAMFFNPALGMAWAKNRKAMIDDATAALRDAANAKGPSNPTRPYITYPFTSAPGHSFVAEGPIKQDLALAALGWLLALGKDHPLVLQMLALLPLPGAKGYEPKVQDITGGIVASTP